MTILDIESIEDMSKDPPDFVLNSFFIRGVHQPTLKFFLKT